MTKIEQLAVYLGLDDHHTRTRMERLVEQWRIRKVKAGDEHYYLGEDLNQQWKDYISREMKKYLQQHPLEQGINKEAIRKKLGNDLNVKQYNALLQSWEEEKFIVIREGTLLAPYNYTVKPDQTWQERISEVAAYYQRKGILIPSWRKAGEDLGLAEDELIPVLQYLQKEGTLVLLDQELYLHSRELEEAKKQFLKWFEQNHDITAAQARELLQTNRKVIISLLEYLDRSKFTFRRGDVRVLAT